jgi:hypothetical protein
MAPRRAASMASRQAAQSTQRRRAAAPTHSSRSPRAPATRPTPQGQLAAGAVYSGQVLFVEEKDDALQVSRAVPSRGPGASAGRAVAAAHPTARTASRVDDSDLTPNAGPSILPS